MPSKVLKGDNYQLPPPILHIETWVTSGKNRSRALGITRKVYQIARPITRDGGGLGPWVFIVDRHSRDAKGQRLRKALVVDPGDDLWVELVFYPDRARMRSIIRRIWKDPRFLTRAKALDPLISKRKGGRQEILSIASLQPA